MNIILLSGGSGKKLWPLSNDVRSKQFIQIFDSPSGKTESMIQRICRQIREIDSEAKITVATSKSQASTVINQLGKDVYLSPEPMRKNTFPAVILAMEYLVDVKGFSPKEPVAICPVDLYVDGSFFNDVKNMYERTSKETGIHLLGAKPTDAGTQYGYILPENNEIETKVKGFYEKPNEHQAIELIGNGALWNAGVFAFRMEELLDIAHQMYSFKGYDDLYNQYESLSKNSIDDIIEKNLNLIHVIRSFCHLEDLGTWEELAEATQQKVIGNAVVSETCKDVNIINDMDVPIIVSGMNGVVIAASQQGILVKKKAEKEDISQYVDRISQKVMFAEKSWGSLKVLDVSDTSMTLHIHVIAGRRMAYHSHEHRDEMWTILSGRGRTVVDGMEQLVREGDVITMSMGCRHTIIADTDLELIEIQRGSLISVNDKQKFELE
jgi:mannose-1-phosphate guanylyltransferase